MLWKKATALSIALLTILGLTTFGLNVQVPVTAEDPPEVSVRFWHTGMSSSLEEFDLGDTFYIEIWIDTKGEAVWSWESGIRFDPGVLEVADISEGNFFDGKEVEGFTPGTISNWNGYVSSSSNSLSENETSGVTGTDILIQYEFYVIGYVESHLNLTPSWTPNPENVSADLVAGTKIAKKVDSTIQTINTTVLGDGYFRDCTAPPPYSPTACFTVDTPEPHYAHGYSVVELDAGCSEMGYDGWSYTNIIEYSWDFENDGSTDATGEILFWNTTGYSEGTYNVKLTVYAPGGPIPFCRPPPYNSTLAYDSTTLTVILVLKCPIAGDVNGDTVVDSTDLGALGVSWGRSPPDPLYNSDCDFNLDNVVDSTDLGSMGINWGQTCS